jgi:hypothetical protein
MSVTKRKRLGNISSFINEMIDNKIPFIIDSNNGNHGNFSSYFIVNFKKIFPRRSSIPHKNFCGNRYIQFVVNINDVNISDYLMFEIDGKFVFLKTSNNSNLYSRTKNGRSKIYTQRKLTDKFIIKSMNINEFIESIKMELCDLENIGEVGYIEGISNIIVKNLKELDITKRPVHCTDKKRETIYIKDENKWEKDENKTQMHKLIKKVVSKNVKMFAKFKEAHPDCLTYHSKYSEQYNKIVYESMGGKGDDDDMKNEKIIKNVLKEVVVNKGSESDT